MPVAGGFGLHRLQPNQDAAGFTGGFCAALLAKVNQLLLENLKFFDPDLNMAYRIVQEGHDRAASLGGCVHCLQKRPDFLVRHIQGAAIANEAKPFQVFASVVPVVPMGAVRFRKQARLLVKPNGFRGAIGRNRQFADFHQSLRFYA